MWLNYVVVMTLVTQVHQVLNAHAAKTRSKRYLIFTPATQYGAFATISVPLHPDTTVSMAWFYEANYFTVDNATWFQPLLGDIATSKRDERSTDDKQDGLTRMNVYLFIENMLEKHGYEGHFCLLRAICENAARHFLHNGILGDILHLVLTPSTSVSEDQLEDTYYEAEFRGLEDQCDYYYEDCSSSPLDHISLFIEEVF